MEELKQKYIEIQNELAGKVSQKNNFIKSEL